MAKIVFTRTYNALNEIGIDAVSRLKNLFKASQIDASGATSSSISHNTVLDGDKITMNILGRQVGRYQILSVIDGGRRPGKFVPIDPLARWIVDRGIGIRDGKGRFVKKTPQNIRRAAYGISYGIMRKGIKPKNIFDQALSGRKDEYATKILSALANDVDDHIEDNMPKGNTRIR